MIIQPRLCQYCRDMIELPTSATQKYHPECYKRARVERERERISRIRGSKTQRACRNCGKTFKFKNSGQRYCCDKCRYDFHNKAAYKRVARETKVCIECGAEFVTMTSKAQVKCRSCRKRDENRARYRTKSACRDTWERVASPWFQPDPYSTGLRVPGLGVVTACPEVCPMEPYADSWVDWVEVPA